MRKATMLALVLFGITVWTSQVAAQQVYGFTVSSSNSDPFVNSGTTTNAPLVLNLWLQCAVPGGMSAAEFDFQIPPGSSNFGFTALNGFLNAGGNSNILLAVGACPQGPVVAGSWTVFDNAAGSYCLVNSAANGIRVAVDCDPINPQGWPIGAIGYESGAGTLSCDEGPLCQTAVEPATWGSIKSLYR